MRKQFTFVLTAPGDPSVGISPYYEEITVRLKHGVPKGPSAIEMEEDLLDALSGFNPDGDVMRVKEYRREQRRINRALSKHLPVD